MEKKSLLSISNDVYTLEKYLIESGGEITPELEGLLEVIEICLPAKVESYAYRLDRLDSLKQYYSDQVESLLKIVKGLDKMTDRTIDGLLLAMENMGSDEVSGITVKFKKQTTKFVEIEDIGKIPGEFVQSIVETRPLKKEIKEAIEAGRDVSGASIKERSYVRKYKGVKT